MRPNPAGGLGAVFSRISLVNPSDKVDKSSEMFTTSLGPSSKAPVGVGGRIVLTLFFLVFFGMGAVFVGLVGRESVAGLRTWTWARTECQITRCGVRETDRRGKRSGDFQVDLQYEYQVGGQTFSSTRLSLRSASYQDYGKTERLAERFPVGSRQICYVNPKAPGEAVLERGSLVFPFLILFPLIFVAIGSIGIYSAWRPATFIPAAAKPISDRANAANPQRLAMGMFAVFMGVGLIAFYFLTVKMGLGVLAARNWAAVDCTVLSSEVRSHSGNHGSTYSVDILYSYRVNGREYKSNRYGFMGGSSSGYSGKQAVVSRYPPGRQTQCYVDPKDPTDAVLVRGFTPIMLIGLFPLVFVFVGFAGVLSIRRKANVSSVVPVSQGRGLGNTGAMVAPIDQAQAGAALLLKPTSSPSVKFLAGVFIALFWNGIVSVFLVQLFHGGRAGNFQWFLGLFLVPFVLIGLALIVMAGYFFLAMFNPRPWITLTPGFPTLGDSVRIEWRVKGRVEALKNFRLSVTGREEATYSRGTRSSTDRNPFAEIEVTNVTTARDIASGVAQLRIPADLMHSFASPHNKIVWSVQVKGEIPRWPDLNEEFAFTVLPGQAKPGSEL